MIEVTRLDGSRLIVNSDLIEFIEATPDTVLSLTTHKKLIVREGVEEVVRRIVAYRQRIHRCLATEEGPSIGLADAGQGPASDPAACSQKACTEDGTGRAGR